MSIDAIRVHLWGQRVGVVARDPATRSYAFQFYPQWLRKGIELAPLTMPVRDGNRAWRFPDIDTDCFRRLPGLLVDSLPDAFGNTLIDAWMLGRGLRSESITELDRLAYMGRRGMGALEFEPANGPGPERDDEVPIVMRRLVEEARQVMSGSLREQNAATTLQHLIRVGTSAGGARAKAVIAWNPDTQEIRSGQFAVPKGFAHWLLKFDGIGRDAALGSSADYGRIEYAYHLMARAAGIQMAECRLLEEGGRAHFMTRRFDRDAEGAKVHMQTLCGLAHLSYKQVAVHSYEQYFDAVLQMRLGDKAMQEAFRRMSFNVAARNQDDHTKNFSFLLARDGGWRLSPAYDVTFAYDPTNHWTRQHLMGVAGKFDGITRQDLLQVADRFQVLDARALLGQVNDAVASWPQFAAKAGLRPEITTEIGRQHIDVSAARRKLRL